MTKQEIFEISIGNKNPFSTIELDDIVKELININHYLVYKLSISDLDFLLINFINQCDVINFINKHDNMFSILTEFLLSHTLYLERFDLSEILSNIDHKTLPLIEEYFDNITLEEFIQHQEYIRKYNRFKRFSEKICYTNIIDVLSDHNSQTELYYTPLKEAIESLKKDD